MAVAEERESRSVALETAYVHDVYDQISVHCCPASSCSCSSLQGAEAGGGAARVWPRVRQFIQDLEPGSLVCDVGCGSGKYLHVNPDVFKVGADRCARLTELAREKEHEVMVCDNLALPYRDDSFDAVLSVAVVHHFATTERRVNALRELARVLRIGGRLLISVWAMEQRHRKFESQDVLVPWHRPQQQQQHLSTPSLELTSTATTATTTSEEADAAGPPPYHAYTQTSDSDSARSVRAAGQQRKRGRSKHKGRSIDPARPSSSQSSSDLSSPNETCYSFVRRALQKLAGGRRGGSRHRAWFLDSWSACTKDPAGVAYADTTPEALLAEAERRAARDDSQDDVADALDLPIELRRLEDVEPSPSGKCNTPPRRRRTLACAPTPPKLEPTPLKSQSLGDILNTAKPESLVRSRSSVARLPVMAATSTSSVATVASFATQSTVPSQSNTSTPSHHPPLVRQKRSLCEDDEEEEAREAEDCPGPAPARRADLRDLVRALPDVGPRRGVPKQRSLNDELMATQRQHEKARVRQNITKQASLNEQLLSDSRGKLGTFKDSLLASPRFQQLRSGLTKLTSISGSSDATKVASQSFKNGFVRILQGWKGEAPPEVSTTDTPLTPVSPLPQTPHPPPTPPPVSPLRRAADEESTPGRCERRLSREDGSDSSKDSSLQSDTSVDSEDSFASVIFVPKPEVKIDTPNAVSPPAEKSPPPNNTQSNPLSPKNILPTEVVAEAETTEELAAPDSPPPQPKTGTIRAETLKRIQQLLQQRAPRAPVFPLVRRSSAHPIGRTEQSLSRPIPRLLSLELFNPETDDLDSDSSGVSSPDSVISVMEPGRLSPAVEDQAGSPACSAELIINDDSLSEEIPRTSSLLEAAASVASSLEGAVDAVIQSSPRARRKLQAMGFCASPSPPPVPPRPPIWDEECRQHLTEFADRLSEKLLQEIDRYSETCTIQSSNSSRGSHYRSMARFPREHECFSPEPSNKLVEEDETEERLDPERYLQGLQEINSDIGSQLAKLHEELDSLPLNININTNSNNNNTPQIKSPNNNVNNNIEPPKLTSSLKTSPITITHANENKTASNPLLDSQNMIPPVVLTEDLPVSSNLIPYSVSPNQSSTRSPKSPSSSLSGPEPPTRQVSWEESVVGSPELRRETSKDSGEDIVNKTKRRSLTRQHASTVWPEIETTPPKVTKTESYETSLSGSTSQDSLQSSSAGSGGPIGAGGALTFHRYYHVFREGELDNLIERYVENLHIISSYYDHANWCVIAEKVQVWTI